MRKQILKINKLNFHFRKLENKLKTQERKMVKVIAVFGDVKLSTGETERENEERFTKIKGLFLFVGLLVLMHSPLLTPRSLYPTTVITILFSLMCTFCLYVLL